MPSTLLKFDNLHNIRDLGGIQTGDGRRIRRGRLIRCGHLANLSDDDRFLLSQMLSTVVDFRTNQERNKQPDQEIPGVEYHHIPIVDSLTAGITREEESDKGAVALLLHKPKEAKEYMCDMYSSFAMGKYALSQYAKFIRLLTVPRDKAVLWHCTAGKDRAGVATVIVLELLGVSREEIIADYLYTRECLAEDILRLSAMYKKQEGTDSPLADESLRYLFGAEEEYILTFYNTVEQKYSNMDTYLSEGLGITQDEREKLRELYLEG